MNKLFCLFSLLSITFTVSASEEWLYYKEYPWIWDHKTEDWLYLKGGEDGKIYAYRNSTKEWEEFNVQEEKNTWDAHYAEWIKDPEPYGGIGVLQQIKEARESGAKELDLYNKNISDLSPLKGLQSLEKLSIDTNNISDLSFLVELTNLTSLQADQNKISDITVLSELKNLKELWLSQNDITDFTPLSGLENLNALSLIGSNLTDISTLSGMTNLSTLYLWDNPITASQKTTLQNALPNTDIKWPQIIDEESSRSTKTADLEIFTDSLDWEAILKSRSDYVYTNYSVTDDGFSTGELRVSISAYDTNYPSIQTTSNTTLDISNYRSDGNGDGIYDILDPSISYNGVFTGTESATYYNNSSYLGNVVFETLFDASRSLGQTFLSATIIGTVTSSSVPEIQVGQTFDVTRDYYTLGWSGTLDYDSTSYQASFSDNQTKIAYSANSQIIQTNESSITLKNFSLPNLLGTTTNTDITLTRDGDIFHKQFISNGITYYFRILGIEDSNVGRQ